MSSKKKYTYYICKDCEIDFLVSLNRNGRVYCPSCGEPMYVESKAEMWIDRAFPYRKNWTDEEDGILIMGCDRGYTLEEIVGALDGRSVEGARNRLKRLREKGLV